MIQDKIIKSLHEALLKLDIQIRIEDVLLEHPAVKEHGDFASNIAMKSASQLKKNPLAIAQDIVDNMSPDQNIERVEVSAPGFINFYLSSDFLWKEVERVVTENQNYGAVPHKSDKRVSIEHTQVNPNKEPHVGHLRNTCIGDVITRLYKSAGFDTKVLYYQNDVGQQIASIVLADRKQFIKREQFPSLISWASAAYSDMEKQMTEDEGLVKEKSEIQVSIAQQNTPEAKIAHDLTTQILKETLEILSGLDIEYDLIVQESDILKNKIWEKTFELLKTKEAFYEVQEGEKKGCWLIKMPHAEDKIIVRSNGVPTYAGNDVANHLWKFGILEDFKYKKLDWNTQKSPLYVTSVDDGEVLNKFTDANIVVNVIDQTQTYPQQSVIESLHVLGYEKEADNYHHVNYGFVYLSRKTAEQLGIEVPESAQQVKISGRKGSVVSISNFLTKMTDVLKEKHGSFTTIDAVRNGAIKFELLKYNTYQDIVFDLDTALDIKGFSGPYIQYAFTRACNVLKKAGVEKLIPLNDPKPFDDNEKKILRMIYRYPEIVQSAFKEHGPHHICLFLFELAQAYNGFYESSHVVGTDKEAERVLITGAVAQIFKNGLGFLGIEAPEKM